MLLRQSYTILHLRSVNERNAMSTVLPTYDDVVRASETLKGVAHRTPVMTSATADRVTGAQVFFKCDNFQRTGAFKFRGAYNSIANLSPEQRQAGVLTFLRAIMHKPSRSRASCSAWRRPSSCRTTLPRLKKRPPKAMAPRW